jgi:hypothetical protein
VAGGSAKHVVPPDLGRTPIPPRVTVPVDTPADPNAETELYGDPIDSKIDMSSQAEHPTAPAPALQLAATAKKPFDWMPILYVIVAIQFAAILYLLAR